jgi:ribosome maturation factor RimP
LFVRPELSSLFTPTPHLEDVFAPAVEAAGFRLVRLRLMGGKKKTLQIMAERPDGGMDVEDCATLSRALSDFLEKDGDPLDEEYALEISSPGIDRPLTRPQDFARWAGHEARIELTAPVDGRKRFKGRLIGLDGSDVVMDVESGRTRFAFAQIAEAKLVLTDALIAEDLKARKARR